MYTMYTWTPCTIEQCAHLRWKPEIGWFAQQRMPGISSTWAFHTKVYISYQPWKGLHLHLHFTQKSTFPINLVLGKVFIYTIFTFHPNLHFLATLQNQSSLHRTTKNNCRTKFQLQFHSKVYISQQPWKISSVFALGSNFHHHPTSTCFNSTTNNCGSTFQLLQNFPLFPCP